MRERRRERERETFLMFRVMGYLGIFLSGHAGAFPVLVRGGGAVFCAILSVFVVADDEPSLTSSRQAIPRRSSY